MVETSNHDLHPDHGGRFVLTRVDTEPVTYAVTVYLPEQRRLETTLAWDGNRAELDPPLADPWAQAETLKLARAVRRTHPRSVTRWRAPP